MDKLWRTGKFWAKFNYGQRLTFWKERQLGIGWHTHFFSWSHKRLKMLTLQVSNRCRASEIIEPLKLPLSRRQGWGNILQKTITMHSLKTRATFSRHCIEVLLSSSSNRPDFTIKVWLCVHAPVCVCVCIHSTSFQIAEK